VGSGAESEDRSAGLAWFYRPIIILLTPSRTVVQDAEHKSFAMITTDQRDTVHHLTSTFGD